jgi:hypothetical protein
MNIQPIVLVAALGCFLLGILEILRSLWWVSTLILLFMFAYFVFSAGNVSVKFKDPSAMRLVILYYVRVFAWLAGAAVTTINVFRSRKDVAK